MSKVRARILPMLPTWPKHVFSSEEYVGTFLGLLADTAFGVSSTISNSR
jgi:hypothetical protein